MKNFRKLSLVFVNIACVSALGIVVFPLLLISKYNYPSADDWSYGVYGYNALKNGGGLLEVIQAAVEAVRHNYFHWEGRFSNAFLAALQPGIWGEQYYAIVAWIMIGSLIFSAVFFTGSLLKNAAKSNNKWLVLPIAIPMLILQILYSPSPEESFYWYTGSVNYTFVYGMSLIFLALFIKLGTVPSSKRKYAAQSAVAGILAILIGGDNFATSLSCLLTLLALSALFLWKNRRALLRTWFLTLLMAASLMLCIFSPANSVRIRANFGGSVNSAPEAVLLSLVRSFTNIYSWTNIKVILMLLFILPFIWKALRDARFSFRLPGLFTCMTFGLYAAQAAPTMYVDGTTGGGRMAAILYYSYLLWAMGNTCYWAGWLAGRQCPVTQWLEKICRLCGKYLLPYCAVVGAILVTIIYRFDLRDLSSYKAYRNWRQGWAQQYASEWNARLEILHDDSIREVVFEPLSVCPEMLTYTDLQEESGYFWVNEACSLYYEKTSILIRTLDK